MIVWEIELPRVFLEGFAFSGSNFYSYDCFGGSYSLLLEGEVSQSL